MKRLVILSTCVVLLVGCAGDDADGDGDGEGEGLADEPDVPCPDCADCAECIDEKCTDLVERCPDSECECTLACIAENGLGNVEFCFASCDLSDAPAGFRDVEQCLAYGCPDVDECNVPADYVPPDDTVLETTDDIGGGALADCAFDDTLAFDPFGDVIQLESADGSVCVKLERVNEGAGQLANTQFTLVGATIGPLGRVASVTSSTDLCWYSSHHNFADWAHVWTGSRRHDVKLEEFGHDGQRAYSLYTSDADDDDCGPVPAAGAPIGEPLKLFPVNP